jgi:hypothetical protein
MDTPWYHLIRTPAAFFHVTTIINKDDRDDGVRSRSG